MNSRMLRRLSAILTVVSMIAVAGKQQAADAKSLQNPVTANSHYLGPNTSGYQNACRGSYSHCILAPAPRGQSAPNPGGLLLPLPSDRRLKRDIVLIDRADNGIGLYRFRYIWSDQMYVGVMAQDVAAIVPDAVQPGADGYLRVDYSRLGLRLQTWQEWRAATDSRR